MFYRLPLLRRAPVVGVVPDTAAAAWSLGSRRQLVQSRCWRDPCPVAPSPAPRDYPSLRATSPSARGRRPPPQPQAPTKSRGGRRRGRAARIGVGAGREGVARRTFPPSTRRRGHRRPSWSPRAQTLAGPGDGRSGGAPTAAQAGLESPAGTRHRRTGPAPLQPTPRRGRPLEACAAPLGNRPPASDRECACPSFPTGPVLPGAPPPPARPSSVERRPRLSRNLWEGPPLASGVRSRDRGPSAKPRGAEGLGKRAQHAPIPRSDLKAQFDPNTRQMLSEPAIIPD